ncbi:putative leucine-rich repeat-containing protein [Senna tora]|uniref:Putative leucine-rich repeat-containing protein n=1 Tax=Senna tora TaxID=362788 RepID=A0A835CGZ3_9FABA|nr:putative leucine-rich repeat-containing protein [Senna tora]
MGESETKPNETVQNALSLFRGKADQNKHQSTKSNCDREKQLEALTKELATCKSQSQAKHAAYMQVLRRVEQYQKLTSELSTLLKKSDTERNKHTNECKGRVHNNELESMMKEVEDQNFGNAKFREKILPLFSELKATQRQLFNKETELLVARDSELKALTKADELEIAFNLEKEKKEQLLQQVEDLMVKTQIGNQAKETHKSSEKSARKSMDQSVYIEALEMELNQLKQQLVNAKKEANGLNSYIEDSHNNNLITIPLSEYESLISKVEKTNEAQASSMVEVGSQSEIVLLKTELKAARAKIGELRACTEQSLSRAESAEKIKADLEEKLKRHREKRQRRRAAMAALREESTPQHLFPSPSEITPITYEPLSKVLNIKF